MVRLFAVLLFVFGAIGQACAGEYAVLSSGSRLYAERHETVGDQVRLFSGQGSIDIPATTVSGFEQEEYAPPKPAPEVPFIPKAAPAVNTPKTPYELVQEAALQEGLPPEFVHSVVAAESAYNPKARSQKGAIGLMQLMPGTAASLQADPHDPAQNVAAGTKLLKELLAKYEGYEDQVRYALAAYNAGPGAVAKYHGVPPYRETRAYVERIVKQYLKAQKKKPS